MDVKIALASCSGMSPNGLISRVANGDYTKENNEVTSICMGSTSADINGENNQMLKKFPIIAINGCSGNCVNKILNSKGIDVFDTIIVSEVLKVNDLVATDSFRVGLNEEKCIKVIKDEIEKKIVK